MSLHTLIDHTYQTFMEQMESARIVLLHPHSRYRSMVVAKLIHNQDIRVFYYAMGPDDINLQSFLTGITQTLANQHPTFGRHINILPPEVYNNPQDHFDIVLRTFIKDLVEIGDQRVVLVLDEYDRSDASDEVQRFVEKLSHKMPDNFRLVLNGRTLPRLPWVAMIAHGRAVMLKDDEVVREEFYGDPNEMKEGGLEVYALGPGFVLQDYEPVDNWEGHLPRLLFFFALDRPVVTRSEICQAFWPDLEPDQAVNVFHVTKRRLHKALDMDVLIHKGGYYQVNPEMTVYYDVTEFVTELMKARSAETVESQMQSWQRIAELYRGPFLQGHNDQWILERRVEFRAGYLEALTAMAKIWQDRDRPEQALALLQKAIDADFMREDVHREMMNLYVKLGRRGEAAQHFKELVELLEEYDLQPSTETVELYEGIAG